MYNENVYLKRGLWILFGEDYSSVTEHLLSKKESQVQFLRYPDKTRKWKSQQILADQKKTT